MVSIYISSESKAGLDAESAEMLATGVEVAGEVVMKRPVYIGALGRGVLECCLSGASKLG